ncbi:MAG TPA: hypothetical protein VGR45_08920 [Stellaceae bacterium]|nr:hypothetical protein [Stellaceae bacterium]
MRADLSNPSGAPINHLAGIVVEVPDEGARTIPISAGSDPSAGWASFMVRWNLPHLGWG